jgi:hypothetical protein
MTLKNKTGLKTLDMLAEDTRVTSIHADSDGIWVDLSPGYNFDGCSGFRSDTAKGVLRDATRIEEGEPCLATSWTWAPLAGSVGPPFLASRGLVSPWNRTARGGRCWRCGPRRAPPCASALASVPPFRCPRCVR